MIDLKIYKKTNGVEPFSDWLKGLTCKETKNRVMVALTKLEAGLLSNVSPIGAGASEMKLDFGAGYRIYFANDGAELIVLLVGGDKNRQQRDIDNAKAYWEDYKQQKAVLTSKGRKNK